MANSVIYDGNSNDGGAVPVDSSTYLETANVTVLGNTGSLTRIGYIFKNWNTSADGSGTARIPAEVFAMPAADVTLYAQWTAIGIAKGPFQCHLFNEAKKYLALSTDTKPTENVFVGSICYEEDTGKEFRFTGTEWAEDRKL